MKPCVLTGMDGMVAPGVVKVGSVSPWFRASSRKSADTGSLILIKHVQDYQDSQRVALCDVGKICATQRELGFAQVVKRARQHGSTAARLQTFEASPAPDGATLQLRGFATGCRRRDRFVATFATVLPCEAVAKRSATARRDELGRNCRCEKRSS